MFTGLIASTGTVVSLVPSSTALGPTRLTVHTPELAPRLNTGDSIAVCGVCLTALGITATEFSADLAEETLRRTRLAGLKPGDTVNLELPTPAGTPLGGHIVQGHVDGVGSLRALDPIDPSDRSRSDWRLRIALPHALTRYVVPQGSITVEGISLTVAKRDGDEVEIAIIPHTYAATALHTLAAGAPLNIETDVLARYSEQRLAETAPPAWTVTEDYLLANGY